MRDINEAVLNRPQTANNDSIDPNAVKPILNQRLNDRQKKRIFSGIQSTSDQKRFDYYLNKNKNNGRNANVKINCGKSNNTFGKTDLLEDLVGMVGLEGDHDNDEIEIGSDYPYAQEI